MTVHSELICICSRLLAARTDAHAPVSHRVKVCRAYPEPGRQVMFSAVAEKMSLAGRIVAPFVAPNAARGSRAVARAGTRGFPPMQPLNSGMGGPGAGGGGMGDAVHDPEGLLKGTWHTRSAYLQQHRVSLLPFNCRCACQGGFNPTADDAEADGGGQGVCQSYERNKQ